MSNLRLRVISGLVLAAAAILLTWLGGIWFSAFCAGIGAVVFFEWTTITRPVSSVPHQGFSAIVLAATLAGFLFGLLRPEFALGAFAACVLSGVLAGRWRWTVLGFCYALAASLPLALLRGDGHAGLATVALLFAVVWATDIAAYFVGRAVGGPKLAPAISPGKTWSGALGGTAGGVAAGVLTGWTFGIPLSAGVGLVLVLLSIVSQAGDLFESWIKRRFGVKDSGVLIPGHGGVMDRVDGLVAAALTLYLVMAAARVGDPRWLSPS